MFTSPPPHLGWRRQSRYCVGTVRECRDIAGGHAAAAAHAGGEEAGDREQAADGAAAARQRDRALRHLRQRQ